MFKFLLSHLAGKHEDTSFWEHAEALRKILIRSILSVFILATGAFFFKDYIFNSVILPPKNAEFITYRLLCKLGALLHTDTLCAGNVSFSLINLSIAGQFRWHIIISLIAGFIIAFPFILSQLWIFVKPALSPKEKTYAGRAVFYIFFLFVGGLLFGYFLILPLSVQFLGNYELSPYITNQITIHSYISTVAVIPLSLGLVFELPTLVFFLTKTGFVSVYFLRKNRKYSVIAVLILAAIITPSTDAFTMMVVALPLYFLYEMSIFIARRVEKKVLAG
ncbi:MAG TPA: twin-arginine translocase subunit TatC [Bacteroidales bacterium]|nr:twin-arginine translocase subunit TatC [Bacteroidales bacterium]